MWTVIKTLRKGYQKIKNPILLTQVLIATSVIKVGEARVAEMAKNIPKTMRAVGLYEYLPISNESSLLDIDVNTPEFGENDVLVEVKAISVNPIDTKQRAPKEKPIVLTAPRILGWDGAGVIIGRGENASIFNIGDDVIFTGDIRKNGSNAQFVALNEILVAPKPKNLDYATAAALPLTSVTAYEALFDRLLLSEDDAGKTLLIINSAGGVGSVASQLAKNLGLKVIGTASRHETREFSKKFGADIVLNHKNDLEKELEDNDISSVDYILLNYDPYPYWDTVTKIIKPQGRMCFIVDSSLPLNISALKDKSLTLTYEMMNTRIKYDTEDQTRHHEILRTISKMLESGKLKSTVSKIMSPINAANLKEAHKLLEDKKLYGKLILTGF